MNEIAPAPQPNADLRAPRLIKRNMTLLALSQSFNGPGIQLAYGFGPLMVIALTGSASLAGLIVGVFGASRFLVAYTAGRITDRYGRRPGILLGQTLSLIGGIAIGASLPFDSFTVFVIGLLIFGMGMSATQQLRVAATDMFPPQRRAQALGYLALGSLVGLVIMPALVSVTEPLAEILGLPHLGVPWLALPVLIIPGMLMVFFVRLMTLRIIQSKSLLIERMYQQTTKSIFGEIPFMLLGQDLQRVFRDIDGVQILSVQRVVGL